MGSFLSDTALVGQLKTEIRVCKVSCLQGPTRLINEWTGLRVESLHPPGISYLLTLNRDVGAKNIPFPLTLTIIKIGRGY